MSSTVLPVFSSKSFIVSGLTFWSLIHFEFVYVYDVRKDPQRDDLGLLSTSSLEG